MYSQEYNAVSQEADLEFDANLIPVLRATSKQRLRYLRYLLVVLCCSLLGNATWVYRALNPRQVNIDEYRSPYGNSLALK